ncbi:hypothetical protein LF887_08640 [Chryseobacterium sp. MEBOG06]|uniref:hypothetical protein n=1 Tax=unclassified Chryseobacterium TaxID=2593645 RepID=UPI001F349FE8|nr:MULTISPECIES: hypothetical protein [unclassified Chryseobacterium]UKB85674.1 hypothetical protein LF887_08640 [Chryseobacterium sp. MEBOG06]
MKKIVNTLALLFCFLVFGISKGQTTSKYIEIEWKNGSEAAKKIMLNEYYYDPLDAWSPFGNDIGSDTYYLYCDWKKEHPKEDIRKFIDEELISSGYPGFDLYMDGKDPERLRRIVDTMQNQYIDLNAIDNKVIALAFSQLFLEGKIEPQVKEWAEAAFSREFVYLDFWGEDDKGEMKERKEREERMNELLSDLRKA